MNEAFDKSELLQEIDDDMEFLAELFDMLENDAIVLMEKINLGLEAEDAESIWQTAHTLKSMVGNFAAHDCHAVAYKVEMAGREERFDDIRQTMPHLETEIKRLLSALTEFLK